MINIAKKIFLADSFHIRTGNVVHGFKINDDAFGVWSGGNSKKINLRPGEKIESVKFRVGQKYIYSELFVFLTQTFFPLNNRIMTFSKVRVGGKNCTLSQI